MKPGEFVYKAIRDEAMKRGADQRIAEDAARDGFASYRKNIFKSAAQLIEEKIKEAVTKTKKRGESLL